MGRTAISVPNFTVQSPHPARNAAQLGRSLQNRVQWAPWRVQTAAQAVKRGRAYPGQEISFATRPLARCALPHKALLRPVRSKQRAEASRPKKRSLKKSPLLGATRSIRRRRRAKALANGLSLVLHEHEVGGMDLPNRCRFWLVIHPRG